MHLFLRLKPIGFILRFFPLLTYSVVLNVDFSGPLINLIFEFLANSLHSIFLSVLSSSSSFSYSFLIHLSLLLIFLGFLITLFYFF